MSEDLLAGVIPGYITHQSLNLFGGPPHSGKTPFLVQMAAALQAGQPFLGHPTQTPPTMGWACLDRPWRETQPWFDKAGISIPYYSLADDTGFDPEALARGLAETRKGLIYKMLEATGVQEGGLLFVDPCPLIIAADGNSYSRVAAGMLTLFHVLKARNITFIGADHAGKQKGDSGEQYARLQDRIIGSAAKQGYASTTMYLSPPEAPTDPHTFEWCPRHRPIQTFSLSQDPTTGFFVLPDASDIAVEQEAPLAAELVPLLTIIPAPPGSMETAGLITQFADTPKRTMEWRLSQLKNQGLAHNPRYGRWQKTAKGMLRRLS